MSNSQTTNQHYLTRSGPVTNSFSDQEMAEEDLESRVRQLEAENKDLRTLKARCMEIAVTQFQRGLTFLDCWYSVKTFHQIWVGNWVYNVYSCLGFLCHCVFLRDTCDNGYPDMPWLPHTNLLISSFHVITVWRVLDPFLRRGSGAR